MQILKAEPRSYDEIFPLGIAFDIEIEYRKYKEAIIGIDGWLEAENRTIIANLVEIPIEVVL